MGWVSPKVYAILSRSEEGKDILEGIADKDQATVDKEVDAFFGSGGKGSAQAEEYAKAKGKKTEKTGDKLDQDIEKAYKKYGDDEDAILEELRKNDYGMSNSDLQGVVESFVERKTFGNDDEEVEIDEDYERSYGEAPDKEEEPEKYKQYMESYNKWLENEQEETKKPYTPSIKDYEEQEINEIIAKNPKAYQNASKEEVAKLLMKKSWVTERIANAWINKNYDSVIKQKSETLNDKVDDYFKNYAFNEDADIDETNAKLEEIENQLPFKDEKEHEKWLDVVSTGTGEEIESFTKEIANRNNPNQNSNEFESNKEKVDNYFKNEMENATNWGERASLMYEKEFYQEAKGDKDKFIEHFINRFGIPRGSNRKKEEEFYSKKFDKISNALK